MFSKFIKPIFGWSRQRCGLSRVLLGPLRVGLDPPARSIWGIPPTQYDMAIPKKLQIGYVVKKHWELIPVFAVTFFSGFLVVASFVSAALNKVDVVFTTHSRNNISRTMDLRSPTIHKLVTLNQQYEPWPEMQDVLDKMRLEEQTKEQALTVTPDCVRA